MTNLGMWIAVHSGTTDRLRCVHFRHTPSPGRGAPTVSEIADDAALFPIAVARGLRPVPSADFRRLALRLTVALDSAEAVQGLAEAARAARRRVGVFVELDFGMRRWPEWWDGKFNTGRSGIGKLPRGSSPTRLRVTPHLSDSHEGDLVTHRL